MEKSTRKLITEQLIFAAVLIGTVGTGAPAALAAEIGLPASSHEPPSSAAPAADVAPCAILEDFAGTVQVLDPSRAYLLDTDVRTGIPCGGWVSIESGWARVVHRDGFRVNAGADSFIQVNDDHREDGKVVGDHFTLYRGQLHLTAGAGVSASELRVVTPHARARVIRGKAILSFSKNDEETQLIVLDRAASLENRFEPGNRAIARAGEATSLHFRAMRVAPSPPQAVAIAPLRVKLRDLRIDDRSQAEAILAAKQRQDRKFAAALHAEGDEDGASRSPAGLVFDDGTGKKPRGSYVRHPRKKDDAKARAAWVGKIVADHQDGEKILFPDQYYGRRGSVRVIVEDPLEKSEKTRQRQEDTEKARLIRELSQLRPD
jgi:hypothetical protein